MCSIYVRHELLRHQVIRAITYLSAVNISDEKKRILINNGYYYDKHLKMCVCFSCNHTLDVSTMSSDIENEHCENAPYCNFILRNDFSIQFKREPNAVLNQYFDNKKVWCQPVNLHIITIFQQILNIHSSDSCREMIDTFPSSSDSLLKPIYDPVQIPGNINTNELFSLTTFFLSMRSAQNRYNTFTLEGHKFPGCDRFIRELATNGFFYTLYGTSVQCFACRLILGNLDDSIENIVKIHTDNAPWCPLFAEIPAPFHEAIDLFDLPSPVLKKEPVYFTKQTNCEDVQCGVCLTNKVDMLLSCGHPICNMCGQQIDSCAFCRSAIKSRTQIFWQ